MFHERVDGCSPELWENKKSVIFCAIVVCNYWSWRENDHSKLGVERRHKVLVATVRVSPGGDFKNVAECMNQYPQQDNLADGKDCMNFSTSRLFLNWRNLLPLQCIPPGNGGVVRYPEFTFWYFVMSPLFCAASSMSQLFSNDIPLNGAIFFSSSPLLSKKVMGAYILREFMVTGAYFDVTTVCLHVGVFSRSPARLYQLVKRH